MGNLGLEGNGTEEAIRFGDWTLVPGKRAKQAFGSHGLKFNCCYIMGCSEMFSGIVDVSCLMASELLHCAFGGRIKKLFWLTLGSVG